MGAISLTLKHTVTLWKGVWATNTLVWVQTPPVNRCDLTTPTRTKTSEQECSDSTASNRRSSTPDSRNNHQSFSRTLSFAFSRSTKHPWTSLAYSQDLSKIYWRVKIWSVVLPGVTPGRQRHSGSSAIYTDCWHWMQPFEACITKIFIRSHSGWHYRCSMCYVTIIEKFSWELIYCYVKYVTEQY